MKSLFKPATDYTREVFNKYGLKPYDAVLETQVRIEGYAPVDLTILKTTDGSFRFAHGSVVTGDVFKTATTATIAAFKWYRANRAEFVITA